MYHSFDVSQYQMVKAYSIIANGGKNVDLTLTRGISNNKSSTEIISESTAMQLKELLINVVEGKNGTGKSLKMDNYTIGGKTGTSRTHIEGIGYSNSRFNTSFTGFGYATKFEVSNEFEPNVVSTVKSKVTP